MERTIAVASTAVRSRPDRTPPCPGPGSALPACSGDLRLAPRVDPRLSWSMALDVTILKKEAALDLGEIARRIERPLKEGGAERAVAFGSYARGEADGFSDLDLAVVLETDLPFLERAGLLHEVLTALPIGVDLLVYTPEEFRRGMERRRGIFDAIAREGVTIHE